jgi:16S rRNA (adenine1518-N6/adenine1519-N6)-dimethyltransferase
MNPDYHEKPPKTIFAKKSLGQNFLTDKNKIRNIVSALDLKNGDTVIEIGPGHGEITKELGIRSKGLGIKIIAIEKDERLAEKFREDIKTDGNNIEIITGDALKILPQLVINHLLQTTHYKLVGNIPFYITGFLLRVLSELDKKPDTMVLTLQKEVAERICARSPKMNLLAASVQYWANPEIVEIIPKKYFNPIPKVDSAVIRMTMKKPERKKDRQENYYKFIKILFKQPRKTILNNLSVKKGSAEANIGKLRNLGIDPALRPQDLSTENIAQLSESWL